jgi:hypothetical protein
MRPKKSTIEYPASLDKLAIVLTIFITLLISAIVFTIIQMLVGLNSYTLWDIGMLLFGVMLLVIYFWVLFYRPLGYSLDKKNLTIHRPLKNFNLPLSDIKSVQQAQKDDLRHSYRVFGVGGLFGYFGWYSNSEIGRMWWYATQRNNYVIITCQDDSIVVLTPDDLSLADKLEQKLYI